MAKVTTVCYNQKTVWSSRKSALDFYRDCIRNSEGSERERYVNIYFKLESGEDYATDL